MKRLLASEQQKLNRAAVLISSGSPLQIQSRLVPVPGRGQLLLRCEALAINPADWKMQQGKTKDQMPCILGSDVAGIVQSIGEEEEGIPSRFKQGDQVLAFAGGAWSGLLDEGAFQTYVLVSANSATRIPPNISMERAATLPMAIATAASALWVTLGIARPIMGYKPVLEESKKGILIYGASAAVGLLAIQIAVQLGFQVFAVASSKHEEYIRSLGAQYFIDRQGSDMMKRLTNEASRANLSEPLRLGLDAVSSRESLVVASECLAACSRSASLVETRKNTERTRAKLAITLNWPEDIVRSDLVDVERTSASHFHVNENNSKWLFNEYLEENLQNGNIFPSPPVRIVEGGLECISEALLLCKQGLSCEKLVLKVA